MKISKKVKPEGVGINSEKLKLNNLRPYFYLMYVLDTMRRHQNDTSCDFIDDLLPWSTKLPEECRLTIQK